MLLPTQPGHQQWVHGGEFGVALSVGDAGNQDVGLALHVHDELLFELPREEEEALSAMLHEVMSNALELSVPLKIDIKTGDNWAEMDY